MPGGRIDTLPLGTFACELPGVAGGPVFVPQPEYEFVVVNGSSYVAGGETGSYLLTGDRVVMTGGKFKGMKFHRISTGFLRRLDESDEDSAMRCILTNSAKA